MPLEDQKRFVTLLSITDLNGGNRRKNVLDNIRKKEYINFIEQDLAPRELNGQLKWENDISFTKKHLLMEGYIEDYRHGHAHGTWKITERGKTYLRELCSNVIKLTSDDYHILDNNAFIRAREILLEDEQEDEQRERELLEDFRALRNEKREVIVQRRIRYQGIVNDLKEKYKNRCQIEGCGFTFEKRNGGFYSEGHHLVPLSEAGTQEADNIVILCPNHHKMLHYARVEVGDLKYGKREVKINGDPHFIRSDQTLIGDD